MKFVSGICLFGFFFFHSTLLYSQTNTYILNGAAIQNNCNCYTLTPALFSQSGSVWNANKIDLNNPFDFVFNVYLGCVDSNGADGIVFMLQPISTSVGTTGEGMGFEGISPSIGISLDTWQNSNRNDPFFDHISIQSNGNITHGTDLAGPVQASPSRPDIEDCQWHTLRIKWDPVTMNLSTWFDGIFRLESTNNLISNVFNNDPMVYWGFSAGTGGSNNLQQFCTALNPDFMTNATSNAVCLGNSITFTDVSQSFAPISSYYWNFGDGFTSTQSNPPVHTYASPGIYEVKLAITGLDGCRSDTIRKTIVNGDYPIANFGIYDTCEASIPRLIDNSRVAVGGISQWNWILDGNPVSVVQQPQLVNLGVGMHTLQLEVTSNHGCPSLPITKTFTIKPRPSITAEGSDGCIEVPVQFSATQTDLSTSISQWNWNFGNGQSSSLQNPSYVFPAPSMYSVQVFATATNGCTSEKLTLPVVISEAVANAGRDTIIGKDIPFQLTGTGGDQYSWSPATGLNNPLIASPVAQLQDDITYKLTVISSAGCVDEDEINITVFKGSAIFVPNAFTPNQDGLNERLKPYYIGIRTLEYFTIFNRWGEIVFSTNDISGGWNGVYKGMQQPSGTYVWLVKATDWVGKVYQLKGTSTIIR